MKTLKKHTLLFALMLCMLANLCACGSAGGFGTKDVSTLVKGNIDHIYLGKYDAEYLKMVDITEEEAEVDVSAMTDEEYMAFTNEYGEIIVQMVSDLLPELGYEEQKSQVIQVEIEDGIQSINEDDFGIFDSYVITYP